MSHPILDLQLSDIVLHAEPCVVLSDALGVLGVHDVCEQGRAELADLFSEFGSTLFEHIMHPEDAERVAQHHARFAKKSDVGELDIEYRMRHSDGEWRW